MKALKLGDRIALMRSGEIRRSYPEEILTRPEDAYIERFVAGVDMTKVLSASDVMHHPGRLPDTAGARAALHLMKEHDVENVFVVGHEHRFRGLVTFDDVLRAIRAGREPRRSSSPMFRVWHLMQHSPISYR